MSATRVLIADDHELFRAGLAAVLETAGLRVVGDAVDTVMRFRFPDGEVRTSEATLRFRPEAELRRVLTEG